MWLGHNAWTEPKEKVREIKTYLYMFIFNIS